MFRYLLLCYIMALQYKGLDENKSNSMISFVFFRISNMYSHLIHIDIE